MKAELRRWAALWSCLWCSLALLLLTGGFIGLLVVDDGPADRAIAIVLGICAAVNAGLLRHFVKELRLLLVLRGKPSRPHRKRLTHRNH